MAEKGNFSIQSSAGNTFIHLGSNKWGKVGQTKASRANAMLVKQLLIAFVVISAMLLLSIWFIA